MKIRSLILALTFLAAPALACGNGECDPTPPDPEPPSPTAPSPRAEDRDPVAPVGVILYGYCCQVDGRPRMSVAWGADPAAALAQCQAREARLTALPDCPPLLASRIRRQEGGE